MKRPATATVVVFVVILLVTAAIVAAVGLGTDGATAITVGDQTESKADLNRELSEWGDFEEAQAGTTAGAVSGSAGATITTQIVYQMLAEQYLEREGERVTSADRAAARDTVSGAARAFAERPKWFRDRYLGRQATFAALTRLVGEDDQGTAEVRVLRREARRTDVSVTPAYGRYAPRVVRVFPYPTPFTPAQG